MLVKYEDIARVYEEEVKKNTKNKRKVYRFERFKVENLTEICDALTRGKYRQGRYNIFLIKSPKYRVVMSMSIKDKIVNHYTTRFVLMPKLEKYLDIRNVATRVGIGRDYAIRLVKKYLEHFKKCEHCYVLKMDIAKYFYTIDHEVLKGMLKSELDGGEYEMISRIISSTDDDYVNETIAKLKIRELEHATKRREEILGIPLYIKGKGLPIGNMSSQFLSIFFLNRIDHKIVHDYHLKYYVRYMDDFLIFSEDREYLKEVKDSLVNEIKDIYKLEINKKKTFITDIKNGVNFCGYRFRIIQNKTVMNVCAETRKRVKKRIKEVAYRYKNGSISSMSAFSSVCTYRYGFKFASKSKMRRLIDEYFWGKFDD